MKEIPQNFALLILRGYKFFVSPMLGAACRYQPSCSDYAMQAIVIHGAMRGGAMAIGRVLRCHPFATGGYNPVRKQSSPVDSNITQTH